jgi:hypothetical protein
MGGNLELGQNLNFAVPFSDVTTLLTIARASTAKPLGSVPASADFVTSRKQWTSVTTGHDYDIRVDGDYVYTDWVNMPAKVKDEGGFARSELKKEADGKWRGKKSPAIAKHRKTDITQC